MKLYKDTKITQERNETYLLNSIPPYAHQSVRLDVYLLSHVCDKSLTRVIDISHTCERSCG
jgi:hypothetical protein